MIFPPYLHPGDCIGIVAPARKISPKEVKAAIDFLEMHHFRVAVGKNLFAKQFQFAGSDEERAADFQSFLDDPDIKAIWCARGGYGSVSPILPSIPSGFAATATSRSFIPTSTS